MSKETWVQEFYPVEAKQAAKGSQLQAAEHALQKWKGYRPENLKKHGLEMEPIPCGVYECALCQQVKRKNQGALKCDDCILNKVRNNTACCDFNKDIDDFVDPHHVFTAYDDPEPMIFWLEKAVEALKE